jgi:hypothetical protein
MSWTLFDQSCSKGMMMKIDEATWGRLTTWAAAGVQRRAL